MLPPARLAVSGQLGEQRLEARAGVCCAERQVDARLGELAQPIVGAAREPQHLQMALEQRDGGQEALALQTLLVLIRAARDSRWRPE